MSDQFNEFDQLFRDKLRDFSTPPPSDVWDNIQTERTFGHVIANRISQNWRILGTLLMLLLAGGSSVILFGGEESAIEKMPVTNAGTNELSTLINSAESQSTINHISYDSKTKAILTPLKNTYYHPIKEAAAIPKEEEQETLYPSVDLIASTENSSFSRPMISDLKLAALLDEINDWSSAKPASAVRFYHMDQMDVKEANTYKLIKAPLKYAEEYDYVMSDVDRKTFRERSSLYFAFTPQTITKSLTPEFNMPTESIEKRRRTEKTRLAYTFEANLHYELNHNKFFESGINFTQLYEEVSISGEKQFSNQYDFVEIPFLLGYKDRNAKWGWFFKTGLGVQVHNNYKGYIFKKYTYVEVPNAPSNTEEGNGLYRMNTSNAVKNIVNNDHELKNKEVRNEVYDLGSDESPFKDGGVVNFHFTAGVTYYHSIRTSFVLSPSYRRNINSLTKDGSGFKEKITFMGVSFGTRINF